MSSLNTSDCMDGIAVIGMSCRFPGARNIDEFWRNLRDGVESITYFSDEDLLASGIKLSLIKDPDYIRAGFVIEDEDLFDASFFGYSPKEAEIMDPQQRLFLETAWEAIEDAGYPPEQYEGAIGVFAGSRMSTYLLSVHNSLTFSGNASGLQVLIGNDKDYLTSRVSYKLNLRGPSVTVQSACSTSLVAVHLACENLLSGGCDMALAGGVAILIPQKSGYLYQEGMVLSPDGHCRAFDARAQGMAPGNGVGIVVLKRLGDALADRDSVHAVIRGSAVNNDGSFKVGYTAPSVDGQAKVIREAQAIAGVEAETFSYIETHGTGTELGDPVEIAAMNKVFGAVTDKKGFCAIGSVKSNIGHLDTVAGVAGLIKTVLAMKHRQLPPSLNFEEPNPKIDFSNSPFFVNARLTEWESDGCPRRAGVSSFGFGGTNAHVVLEEAREIRSPAHDVERPLHLITLSAKSETALQELAHRYAAFLESHPDALLGDICFTANVGRSHFPYRLSVVTESSENLRDQMAAFADGNKPKEIMCGHVQSEAKQKVLFTEQGIQYIGDEGQYLPDRYSRRLSTLGKVDDDLRDLLKTLGELYVRGINVDWNGFDHDCQWRRISLPTYPFERKRYWIERVSEKLPQVSPTSSEVDSDRVQETAGDWFYEVKWKEKGVSESSHSDKPGTWVVFADKGGVGQRLAEFMDAHGEKCVLVFAEGQHEIPIKDSYNIDPLNPEDFVQLFQKILGSHYPPCRGVIHLWSMNTASTKDLTADDLKTARSNGCISVLHLVQAMARIEWGESPRLCLITRGSQPAGPESVSLSVAQSPLWGIGKVITKEHPELNCLKLDLDPLDERGNIHALWEELRLIDTENEVAFRDGLRYVPRLVRSSSRIFGDESSIKFRSDSTYLITGGLGALGLEIARWMVACGAKHLMLLGRKGPSDDAIAVLNGLKEAGVRVDVFSIDVTDQDQLARFFSDISESMPPLRGILHAAGVLEPGAALLREKHETLAKVMAPKVEGAWNLHMLSRTLPLDFFVCFSSVVSLWGIHGMGSYTAANTFLDALAHYRRSQRLPAMSINWGPWSEIGVVSRYNMSDRLAMQGLGTIAPQQGMALLGQAMQRNFSQVAAIAIDWPKVLEQAQGYASFFFEVDHVAEYQEKNDISLNDKLEFLGQLQEESPTQRQELLEHYLRQKIAKELHLDVDQITKHGNLIQMGMDSLIFLNLSRVISKELQITVRPNELFDTPFVSVMAERFAGRIMSEKDVSESDVDNSLNISAVPDSEKKHLPFDLTDIQHAYWIGRSDVLELGNVACHGYFEIEAENLDLDRYTRAWQRSIERHDMLRAVILSNGQQRILEHVPPYQIEVLDLTDKKSDAVKSRLEEIRQHMSHQVLSTDQWPLFEIRASRINQKRIRLHISLDLLIADAYSIGLILQEVFHFYRNPETIPNSLEFSFRDYVLAEIAFRNSDIYKRSREYWINRLPELPPAPELPLAKNPGEIVQPRFVRRAFRLKPEAWLKLKNRASQAGLTSSGILLAVYAEILSVWCKRAQFSINVTLFNRLPVHSQVNDIVGDFTTVNLLAVDNSGQDSFMGRALRIQKQLWEDINYRYFGGVRVLRELGRNKKGALGAIMPVVFTSNLRFRGIKQDDTAFAVLGEVVYSITQTPQVWLDNQLSEDNGALLIYWDAVEELFPEGLLDDMFDAYCHFIRQLADEEEAWQETTHGLLPAAQLEKRASVNATQTPVSSEMLHTLFANQVLRQPDHPAVISSNHTLSYEELSHRSSHIGRLLRENGAEPNTLVAVVMEKGWEQVVGVLGILQSGAAYLPIDPSVPKERFRHILDDGKVSLVLTQSWLDEKLEWPEDIQRVSVDTMDVTDKNSDPLDPVQRPEDLAYVIYTSGSTGLPKGVMIDHRGAVNTILDVNQRFDVGTEDRVLALANLNFDLSVYDIFGSLAAGGTIVLPDADKTKDPARWLEMIARNHVTVWNSVPALMQMLVEYASSRTEVMLHSLRLVLLSGDWIPLDLADQIKALMNDVRVIGLGGATEASIWSNLYSIEEVSPDWKSIPYGRPMVNQHYYVLNEFMEDCPDWVPGQLYIGGIGLAHGYWRDEEKTKGSFIIHSRTGERLYRTGDLGRYLPDGNIEFLGREDFQVKISGYRIELGEIEAALKEHPKIKDAVVIATGDQKGEKHLVGYAVPAQGEKISQDEIQDFLRGKLVKYMVPGSLIILDALPMTPNGKVDRKGLPLPGQLPSKPEVTYVAPRNELEQSIASVLQKVLEIKRAGIHDKFFNLGANSLHIVRIQNKLKEILKQDITVLDLFENTTISELAQYLNSDRGEHRSVQQARTRAEARKRSTGKKKIRKKSLIKNKGLGMSMN